MLPSENMGFASQLVNLVPQAFIILNDLEWVVGIAD
jgi:hypothetical protein